MTAEVEWRGPRDRVPNPSDGPHAFGQVGNLSYGMSRWSRNSYAALRSFGGKSCPQSG